LIHQLKYAKQARFKDWLAPLQIVQAVQSIRDVQNVIQSNTEEPAVRDERWSEAIAVCSLAFLSGLA